MDTKFWTKDPKILFSDYASFMPSKDMTRYQQLNAMTRFCIYYILLLILLQRESNNIILPIIVICIIVCFYYVDTQNDDNNKNEDKENMINIESGKYDFSKKLRVGGFYGPPKSIQVHEPKYSYDEYVRNTKQTCRKPTIDNPFMNQSSIEYGDTYVPAACNADDEDIKENIKTSFNENLYMDIDAVWEKENSQRQFYTIPNTSTPNQQIEFAKWCFNMGDTCKENQMKCYRYEDVRFNKF